MDSWHRVNREALEQYRLAPIQFAERLYLSRTKQFPLTQWNDEAGISAFRQPPQTRQVQVVIVIMAQQHHVDPRKILHGYTWLSVAPRTRPGKRTRSLRPHRIRQDVQPTRLNKNG